MSEIRANTISDAAGTGPVTLTKQSAAKTWVYMNGAGTAVIYDSINVSGLVDNGTGDYTLSYTSAFATNLYSTVTDSADTPIFLRTSGIHSGGYSASSTRYSVNLSSTGAQLDGWLFAHGHGDLA